MTKIRVVIRWNERERVDPEQVSRAVAAAVGRQMPVPGAGTMVEVEAYVENHRATWVPGPPERLRVGRWQSGVIDGAGTIAGELDRLAKLLQASDAGGNWRGEVEQAVAHLKAALAQGSGVPDLIEVSSD